MNNIINLKRNKKPNKNQMDEIVHSFPSYAATFKTFRPKTQYYFYIKNAAKTKWKNLRDPHMKFKKGLEGQTGQAKKYCKWPWSRHMSFIDGTFLYRQRSSNIPEDIQNENDIPPSVGNSATPEVNTNERPSSSQMLPPAPPKKSLKCRSVSEDSDVVNNIINLKRNKKPNKNQMDEIDHSFLSYAATFKTFRPKTQVMLKLKLATLFSETETLEIQEQEVSLTTFSSSTSSGLTTIFEIPEEYSRGSAPSASSDNPIQSMRDVDANFVYNNQFFLVLVLCLFL
ncbi:hypothetical protein HHI36_001513 [Cryptolaemus montrouzieri]|uniref:BESS domain-containing protein n=1 Tax=Cryptolaemus montrouzieri TaxID=559131 RepID=A0ABD2P8G6_9CUCU